ncbi:amino acid transporter [Allokutzneria sp. A3M-2-11 16]|uniref:nucleotidyltransferase domain-containing protein n=1 Tax=Allokutzneria sp. A3M-2-11 16 TaxID=2962043 RepID=UPI0020B77A56|nr:amino acid transporter [Allokutzneria sp. A3M-2-11 16]MCP3797949.1 amino acid transporter [Allokutzneria sp. A3M-2-11 16]
MGAELGSWEPATPAEVAAWFADFDGPWWIAGGWAIEFAIDPSTVDERRRHADIDVMVLREHHLGVHRALPGWELWAADPPGTLRPWPPGQPLPTTVHDVWCRPGPESPWRVQIMIDESAGEEWISRRDTRIRRPLAEIGAVTTDGLPFLRPEIQLYYKSRDPRDKDEQDFAAVVAHLTAAQQKWLREAIAPSHPWLTRLHE